MKRRQISLSAACADVCRAVPMFAAEGLVISRGIRGTAPQQEGGRLLHPTFISYISPPGRPWTLLFFLFHSSCFTPLVLPPPRAMVAPLQPLPLALLSLVLSLALPDAHAAATPRRQPSVGRSIQMSRRNALGDGVDLDQWLKNNKLATERKYGMNGGSVEKRGSGFNQ